MNNPQQSAQQTEDQVAGVDFSGLQDAADGICEMLDRVREQRDEAREDRDECVDVLLNWVDHCPDCQGYGAIVNHDDTETPCEFCAPARRLIERLRPFPTPPQPAPAEEIEDDIAF